MAISIGVWPWPDRNNWTNISDGDRYNLARWGGGVPFLAYAWPSGLGNFIPLSWQWLSEHGYRECVLRLFLDDTSSDTPHDPPSAVEAVQRVSEAFQEPVKHGIQLIGVQFDNEPNLERSNMNPQTYAAWCLEFIAEWRRRFPTYALVSPPLAQDTPNYQAWFEAMKPVAQACEYVGVHYYFGRKLGDTLENAPYSPEHFHSVFPDKELIISECGNATTQHDLAAVLLRWASYSYVRSFHVFVLSSENFPTWNYTEATGNVLNDIIRFWRIWRRYPLILQEQDMPTEPTNATGGATAQQFAELWNQWVAAGGPENNFRKHLLGIGVLEPTTADMQLLINEAHASTSQLHIASQRFPFK